MTENTYNNGQTHFGFIIVDSDTALFQAAKFVQEDFVIVKNKMTGKEREYRNKTTFQGGNRKGEIGGELKELCEFMDVTRGRDDFEITQYSRLRPDIDNHLEEAEKQFAYFVKSIKDLDMADDYKLCLGGEGNFRYETAKILPYKGERKEKPIVFSDLRDKIFAQYKTKTVIANGYEADDTLGMYGAQNQAFFRKTGQYKYLLGYIDKDIRQVWGPTLFLNHKELGIQYITPFEAAHHFAYQILRGDLTVDNIQGLPDLAAETKAKYGLRKIVGCGEVAAKTILEDCKEIPELFAKVVEAYKDFYGDREYPVGDLMYTWKDFLRENALLLWMMRTKNQRFDIFPDLLDKLGVKYA